MLLVWWSGMRVLADIPGVTLLTRQWAGGRHHFPRHNNPGCVKEKQHGWQVLLRLNWESSQWPHLLVLALISSKYYSAGRKKYLRIYKQLTEYVISHNVTLIKYGVVPLDLAQLSGFARLSGHDAIKGETTLDSTHLSMSLLDILSYKTVSTCLWRFSC